MARYRIKRMPLSWVRQFPSARGGHRCVTFNGVVVYIALGIKDAIRVKKSLIQQDKEKK